MTRLCSNFFPDQFKKSRILFCALLMFAAQNPTCTAQPVLSLPVLSSNGREAQITVSNCYSSYAEYLLQASTNLTDWSTISTNSSTGSNFSVTVYSSNSLSFYRLRTALPFLGAFAILCKSNIDFAGNNVTIDSFDSSTVADGQYNTAVRQANANVGVLGSLTDELNVANANIFGSVYTGIGSMQNAVEIGVEGSVGDISWVDGGNHGIEPGHWNSLNLSLPDVPAPNTAGWSTILPPSTNGIVVLNGGNYVVSSLSYPLVVSNTTAMVWVDSAGSVSLGVTITNGGQLILFVGQSTGSGTSLNWSGVGTSNVPGYAANLQIYGLPSLTSINFGADATWIGTVYAPEAAFVTGGGGLSPIEASGQIITKSINANGHWNFHYDEHLAALNLHP